MPDNWKTARKPYPLSWDAQNKLFALLPHTIASVALFKVNTGGREQEVCLLRWLWEVSVPELETSVFVIPDHFGGRSVDRASRITMIASWSLTTWQSG